VKLLFTPSGADIVQGICTASSTYMSLKKWGDAHVFVSWMHLFCTAIDTQCIFVGKLIPVFCVKSLLSLT
jgi:hypothetical protein